MVIKLDVPVQMFNDESWKPIYSGVKRLKLQVNRRGVFALLWVLAFSAFTVLPLLILKLVTIYNVDI